MAAMGDRSEVRIAAGDRLSFGSYFNAFPASYWQHWTQVRRVRLVVRSTGPATIFVYRSDAAGVLESLATREVIGDATAVFDLSLDAYSEGGWIWFDVAAGERDMQFLGAEWTTEQEPVRRGKASLGITTYNKPDYCVETLRALAAAPELLEHIDRVFLVDQGTDRVDAQPGFDEIAERLGQTLEMIAQPNLGGSGGFARAMHETLQRPGSDFVQLLDDDVRIEPESLRRSIVFGRYTTRPSIVGAHMFDLLKRSQLHAWAEVVDDAPFMWRPVQQDQMPHDFAVASLRTTPGLHRRLDADYNGWWMCLIPVEIIRRVGLPLPVFIKWDDAEYCLRARAGGYRTVTVPGVAIWHISWVSKDDTTDWQAYFHARNRIVTALLHSRSPRGGTLLRHSRRVDLKHLMLMQYFPVALRHRALRDVLAGPYAMASSLADAMPAARALAGDFPETRTRRGGGVSRADGPPPIPPRGWRLAFLTVIGLLRHAAWPVRPAAAEDPAVEIAKQDAVWWRMWRLDRAMVATADGSSRNFYARDQAAFRAMLRSSIRLHASLRREWTELSNQYRAALADVTSPSAWEKMFPQREP
jgi:galactofuranosylgalactofuranosylrhamnosyl-N-acetylglucosaminyl-diphospho-decaprenol beta-1,5/1,6-galactofuranosyltransferase